MDTPHTRNRTRFYQLAKFNLIVLITQQWIPSSWCWSCCWFLRSGRRFRRRNCWWCWCAWHSPTATSVCRHDSYPDFRWSAGIVWLDCSHLFVFSLMYCRRISFFFFIPEKIHSYHFFRQSLDISIGYVHSTIDFFNWPFSFTLLLISWNDSRSIRHATQFHGNSVGVYTVATVSVFTWFF